uniref:RING-type domain-containing protein n=2 Tax=Lactuca sativa TaxID=4236 RepID=A0A9R1UUR7_LACSA|nr:hypothetical protein LSAT_V11C800415410 [Lactuca sativa]
MPNPNRHHNLETHHRHDHANSNTPSPSPPKPSPKLLSIFLKVIVMFLILSLFLLFLGLAAILLLLAGSFLHRRRQRLRLRSPPPRTSSSFSLHDIQNHIPPFQYPAADKSTAAASDDCSICLEYFNEGEICRVLPVCDHVFHARCVDKWLTKVPNCPICRTRVRLDDVGPSDSMISDEETKFLWAIGVAR